MSAGTHLASIALKLFREGITAYQHGDIKSAVEKLSKAIYVETGQEEPDFNMLSDIHNMRGEAYFAAHAAFRSQLDFNNALLYKPNNANALNNLGVWHTVKKFAAPDYISSLDYFEQALELEPDRKDIILNRAIARIRFGNPMGYEDLKKLELEKYRAASLALKAYDVY